ncbi:manganese efflux pump MntP [Clostridium neonatale]|uniref:manganese efflux pump MntP n=1 Tax=Clostridium neonatale TaxID=137838 RepID=UPI00374F60C7
MSVVELFILAVGLSMDAFAVAICKGLCMRKVTIKKAGIVGLYFGLFQAGMLMIGYILGSQFSDKISSIDHWIVFILLSLIGISMIKESLEKEEKSECKTEEEELSFKNMSILAVATSIDALAVGVTFAFLKVNIIPAVSFIGITTLVLSMIGVKIGNIFGVKYKSKAELVGGIILILMGIKILLEHLGILG